MDALIAIMAQAQPTLRERIQQIKLHFGLPNWIKRLNHNLEVEKTVAAITSLPNISPIRPPKPNNNAVKQLNDLVVEGRVVAREEIAILSKPTARTSKDRIFEFVEAANRPVTVAEIASNLPDIAKSGVSSRTSELRFAGTLSRIYMAHPITGVFAYHYTVAESR